jgi:hypothetical protein
MEALLRTREPMNKTILRNPALNRVKLDFHLVRAT